MQGRSGRRATGWPKLAGALLAGALAVPAAWAVDPVNATRKGQAIEGYDPVAYFTDGKPVEGRPELSFAWQGATWLFASAEHRDAFAAAPERYAPQYGGYCGWAVSEGYTAEIDPAAWKIVDGKLYLNYSPKIQAKWEKDRAVRIERANANWPRIRDGG